MCLNKKINPIIVFYSIKIIHTHHTFIIDVNSHIGMLMECCDLFYDNYMHYNMIHLM